MFSLEGVSSGYGGSQVLFDLDLAVGQGEVLALVGRNGAGKTTTFRTICGQLPLQSGQIALEGVQIGGRASHSIARAGVGLVPEDRQVFGELSVHDNIMLGLKAGPSGQNHWNERNVYDAFPLLGRLRARMAGRLSGGEQQMLTMARTLVGNPTLLLLDEPSEGLAPVVVAAIADLVRTIAASGVTVIMAEQNIALCIKVATHAAIIERGRIVFCSTMGALAADEGVKRKFLAV